MAKLLKCQHCQTTDAPKEDMEVIEKVSEQGKITRTYVHKKCWSEYSEKKAFTDKENAELDDLYNVIRAIHKIDVPISKTFFSTCLQPVRNGNYRQGKKVVKRKEGYPYYVIQKAYEIAKDNIMWSRKNVEFESVNNELKYCFAIVLDKLPMALKKIKQDKRQEEVNQELQTVHTPAHNEKEVKYKKKKEVRDFSDFLD